MLVHLHNMIELAIVMRVNSYKSLKLSRWRSTSLISPRSTGLSFTKGWLGDRLVTRSDRDPRPYQEASKHLAPGTSVRIVEPGVRVEL